MANQSSVSAVLTLSSLAQSRIPLGSFIRGRSIMGMCDRKLVVCCVPHSNNCWFNIIGSKSVGECDRAEIQCDRQLFQYIAEVFEDAPNRTKLCLNGTDGIRIEFRVIERITEISPDRVVDDLGDKVYISVVDTEACKVLREIVVVKKDFVNAIRAQLKSAEFIEHWFDQSEWRDICDEACRAKSD